MYSQRNENNFTRKSHHPKDQLIFKTSTIDEKIKIIKIELQLITFPESLPSSPNPCKRFTLAHAPPNIPKYTDAPFKRQRKSLKACTATCCGIVDCCVTGTK